MFTSEDFPLESSSHDHLSLAESYIPTEHPAVPIGLVSRPSGTNWDEGEEKLFAGKSLFWFRGVVG